MSQKDSSFENLHSNEKIVMYKSFLQVQKEKSLRFAEKMLELLKEEPNKTNEHNEHNEHNERKNT